MPPVADAKPWDDKGMIRAPAPIDPPLIDPGLIGPALVDPALIDTVEPAAGTADVVQGCKPLGWAASKVDCGGGGRAQTASTFRAYSVPIPGVSEWYPAVAAGHDPVCPSRRVRKRAA